MHRLLASSARPCGECGSAQLRLVRCGRFGLQPGHTGAMKVLLRNPRRELTIDGKRSVNSLLAELQLARESHLVIRNGTLVPGDAELTVDDVVEIRPVISGGA